MDALEISCDGVCFGRSLVQAWLFELEGINCHKPGPLGDKSQDEPGRGDREFRREKKKRVTVRHLLLTIYKTLSMSRLCPELNCHKRG